MPERYPIAVLVSGGGTNLQALIDTLHRPAHEATAIALVVASRPDAPALARAERAGIPTAVVRSADHPDREARDRALADVVAAAGPELVVLAGWMSILTGAFLARFPDGVINLHPSLLPAFPGLEAIRQARDWGARVTGATVHYVDEEVDGGPPILQEALPVGYGESLDSLTARVHAVEHRLLPEAVRLLASGRVRRDPDHRRVVHVIEEVR